MAIFADNSPYIPRFNLVLSNALEFLGIGIAYVVEILCSRKKLLSFYL